MSRRLNRGRISWQRAVDRAILLHLDTGRRMYVRGYRNVFGQWRYGVYREDRPPLVSRGWAP